MEGLSLEDVAKAGEVAEAAEVAPEALPEEKIMAAEEKGQWQLRIPAP